MADITMCDGKNCPIKEKCYRFTAKPTPEWQSYFSETPKVIDNKCDQYYSRD